MLLGWQDAAASMGGRRDIVAKKLPAIKFLGRRVRHLGLPGNLGKINNTDPPAT